MPADVGSCMAARLDLPGLDDGARTDGVVGGLVDQNECSGVPVVGVAVGDDDGAGSQCHGADVVERQLNWLVGVAKRLGVPTRIKILAGCPNGLSRLFE